MIRTALVLAAGISFLSLASAASAADLIVNEPASPGVVDVSGSWGGPYIGVFAGGAWGSAGQDITDDVFDGDSLDMSGWLIGVNVGADFAVADGVVAGIVGDIAWSDISGTDDVYDSTVDINWAGSIRGRLGFDGGAFLPYLTGGVAFANATANYAGDEDSNTHIGWTVGAGVEIAATDSLSIDLLYRYTDYGTQTYEIVPDADLTLRTHALTVGLNWRF